MKAKAVKPKVEELIEKKDSERESKADIGEEEHGGVAAAVEVNATAVSATNHKVRFTLTQKHAVLTHIHSKMHCVHMYKSRNHALYALSFI
jgi:hypothetical protein